MQKSALVKRHHYRDNIEKQVRFSTSLLIGAHGHLTEKKLKAEK